MHRSRYQRMEKDVSPGLQTQAPAGRVGRYLFMRRLLAALNDGPFVYRAVAQTVKGLIAVMFLAFLATFFKAGQLILGLNSTGAIAGGILYQLFYAFGVYSVIHIFIIRAQDIAAQKPAELFMLSLGAMLVRMLSEAYAAFVAFISMGGAIFVWFTGMKLSTILGSLSAFFPVMTDTSFLGGIGLLFSGLLLAIGAIIGGYMLAELLNTLSNRAAGPARIAALPRPAAVKKASRPPRVRSRFDS